jgi:hypothetical protein
MPSPRDIPSLEHVKTTLAAIAESVVILTVERDACEELAEIKGASLIQIRNAKRDAVANPAKMKAAREQYAELRQVLSENGIASFLEALALDLQQKQKVN